MTTATSMAGALWQMAAPGTQLRAFYESDPELSHSVVDVEPRLTGILTALLTGYALGSSRPPRSAEPPCHAMTPGPAPLSRIQSSISGRPGSTFSMVMGKSRTRTPVALNTAFATDAPAPQMPSSPTPFAPRTLALSS